MVDVILQEGSPRLRRRLSAAAHVLSNAGLTDVDAELEQLAVDAWRPTADSLGSSVGSALERLSALAAVRVVHRESSTSRTTGSPCDATR